MLADGEWFSDCVEGLTDDAKFRSPSQWAEESRVLPAAVTARPGPFSFEVTPYLVEPLDCLDVRSPVREVVLMKSAQIGATAGILENALGYFMAEVKTAPCMFLTATDELAKERMESHIGQMIAQSEGLEDLVASLDDSNKRRSGRTAKKVTVIGGGSVMAVGARSAARLRSFPIRGLFMDELDGFPGALGKEGDPVGLAENRTRSFGTSKKILKLSTPLEEGTSKILDAFKRGDQRYFFVPCLRCGEYQRLRFKGENSDGTVYGLTWEMNSKRTRAVPGSARYLCQFCQFEHINSHKGRMLRAGEWRPTETPADPWIRSYHINALYSPVGMMSWDEIASEYLKGYDMATETIVDPKKHRVFWNTVLGRPWDERGKKLHITTVSRHQLREYKLGEIPNKFMREHAGGPAALLICTVDVQEGYLRVGVFAFTPGERMFLIDHHRWDGDVEDIDCDETWNKLADLIDHKVYTADDGRTYRVGQSLTFVDSGHKTDVVYDFCAQWESGVLPIKGRAGIQTNRLIEPTEMFATKRGTFGVHITVDYFKDWLSSKLKRVWNGRELMPLGHWSAPANLEGKYLKELTVEQKGPKFHPKTNQFQGMLWSKPHHNARNELWDLSVYARAALSVLAKAVLMEEYELPRVHMPNFWHFCEYTGRYFKPAPGETFQPPPLVEDDDEEFVSPWVGPEEP